MFCSNDHHKKKDDKTETWRQNGQNMCQTIFFSSCSSVQLDVVTRFFNKIEFHLCVRMLCLFVSFFFGSSWVFPSSFYLLWHIFEMPNVLKHHLWYFSESILLLMNPEEVNVDCQQGNRDKIFLLVAWHLIAKNSYIFSYFSHLMDVGEISLHSHLKAHELADFNDNGKRFLLFLVSTL